MQVMNVRWIGVGTTSYAETVRLFGDVLDMPRRFDESGTVEFGTAEGDAVQVMGPGHPYSDFFARHAHGPMPLLEVDHLDEARRRLTEAGIEVVAEPGRDDAWDWLNFRGPDGNLYELGERRGA